MAKRKTLFKLAPGASLFVLILPNSLLTTVNWSLGHTSEPSMSVTVRTSSLLFRLLWPSGFHESPEYWLRSSGISRVTVTVQIFKLIEMITALAPCFMTQIINIPVVKSDWTINFLWVVIRSSCNLPMLANERKRRSFSTEFGCPWMALCHICHAFINSYCTACTIR